MEMIEARRAGGPGSDEAVVAHDEAVCVYCPEDGLSGPLWRADAERIVSVIDKLCGPHEIRPFDGEVNADEITARSETWRKFEEWVSRG
jgi:hypothetical protein